MTKLPDGTIMEGVTPREIVALPRIDEFYDMLQYRINMTANDYYFSNPFTVFFNVISRRKERVIYDRYDNIELIYTGTNKQRSLLENMSKRKGVGTDEAWAFLQSSSVDSSKAIVGSRLYQSFRQGSYNMQDVVERSKGSLKDYFVSILNPQLAATPPTTRQLAEYTILSQHFNLDESSYLSIPLVLFGEIDGILHFVYSTEDEKRMTPRGIGGLIRVVSAMYETQILEWDLVNFNPEKAKAIMKPLEPDFYKNVNRNPILQELGFEQYYRNYIWFYQERIRFNDELIHSKVYRPYLKAAITAIMIDSFAHNVSAHSLVALNWWFKQRAENLRQNLPRHQEEIREFEDIIRHHLPEGFDQDRVFDLVKPWINGLFVRDLDPEYDVLNMPGPLAREIQPLLKFLMQKGAFWSGIARDNSFGGESANAYEVLWNDFINNPLYLGTIAKSENIHKIKLRVILYEPFSPASVDENKPWLRPKKPLVDGVFVEIDLKHKRPDIITHPNGRRGYPYIAEDCLCLEEFPELDEMSDFVFPGKEFKQIKEVLTACNIFFPGEVVGRHAFFTLLENKIRNVKHFKGAALQAMQQNGLELCLSLQECPIQEQATGEKPLFNVGLWINAPAKMDYNKGISLIKKRYQTLASDIMDRETFAPQLGGGFQDKLCASLLFNNYFIKVQNGDGNEFRDRLDDNERDVAFYPWITPAASPLEDVHADIEVKSDYFKQNLSLPCPEEGYLKKYFYLWKAADIYHVNRLEDANLVWENLSRFKFVHIAIKEANQRQEAIETIKTYGVQRLIVGDLPSSQSSEELLAKTYRAWLAQWCNEKQFRVRLFVDNALSGQLVFIAEGAEPQLYYLPAESEAYSDFIRREEDDIKTSLDLHLAHGGNAPSSNVLRYRNHGIYRNYFQPAFLGQLPSVQRSNARIAAFFEMLTTRICIFDSRVFYRMGNAGRQNLLQQQLLLRVYGETAASGNPEDSWFQDWDNNKADILRQCNFLVLHLSFIEKILYSRYADHPDYSEENIGLFIEQEIAPGIIGPDGRFRANFTLIITTGRGRTKWWTKLSANENYESYKAFTNFRPVESIISAVEDAASRKDDIEIKYNLVKVMFGS